MSEIVKYILGISPSILLPIIIIIMSLFMKMKLKDALMSGITLAIAFTSISLVIGFMFNTISPVAQRFVEYTSIKLDIIDVGFSPMVTISFAWKFMIIMFPLQIILNILMIHFNFTNVLNVDIFNIWTKVFTAAIVSVVSKSIIFGFIASIIQILLELKISEKIRPRVEQMTGIVATTITHVSIIQCLIMYTINNLLDKVSFIRNTKLDIGYLKNRIGVFGEDSVMGFLIGMILSIFSGYSLIEGLEISVKLASALVLLPIIANMFVKALNPVSEVAKNFMKSKYKDRDIVIGLEWTILGSIAELWIVSVLLIPITLILALLFSKLGFSSILPLAGIINPMIVVPALIISNRNLLKMLILGIIITPIYLMVSTNIAPAITELSKSISVNGGQLISYYSFESPYFRWTLIKLFEFKVYGIVSSLILILLFMYFYKNFVNKKI
ncbi:PTS galactitol transporter subunit IIC [Streptobacillus moniliformis]|uniref:PTS system Galactitol-specific IIC component n=1 Tax=Streptobacillus moniliformis (strain ATCC 14647 / DSM 12112 / NCTC 10651 / 9901) TaxID=519441 RepID=D1AVS9_STRM9|nr:PTS transporter subunit IIC [Streptobacillus moniliformis]ACZ01839.1 PTS system Galactitol-specific IIC component [Streptobacillus moniliformis DSM 12112]AVL43167.1 PTS galactitol transporter subunit IIC [Streptobacillus moniliformis]SQA12960.1 PTS system galactitol-specific EIIC component [Streptobacillus moniliformis]